MILEKEIEKCLICKVRLAGGLAVKFVSPGMAGVPDRLVLLPNGKALFAELKAPGQKMRPLQVKRKRQLEGLGFEVYCLDSYKSIEEMLHDLQTP